MARRPSNYDSARKELVRRAVEKSLVCERCGYRNKPGAIEIDVDEHDTAWCRKCDYNFAVYVSLDG